MPPLSYWIRQYLFAIVSMFALLLVVDLLGGEVLERAWPPALLWAVIASTIFIGARYRKVKRVMGGAGGATLERKK